jgi:acylphosphatase
MQVRAHIFIYGEVQGVFFRRTAKSKAEELGIRGWVRNRPDGGVETVAQGSKSAVEKFIAWCKKGPPFAKVEKVEVEWRKSLERFEDFSII